MHFLLSVKIINFIKKICVTLLRCLVYNLFYCSTLIKSFLKAMIQMLQKRSIY